MDNSTQEKIARSPLFSLVNLLTAQYRANLMETLTKNGGRLTQLEFATCVSTLTDALSHSINNLHLKTNHPSGMKLDYECCSTALLYSGFVHPTITFRCSKCQDAYVKPGNHLRKRKQMELGFEVDEEVKSPKITVPVSNTQTINPSITTVTTSNTSSNSTPHTIATTTTTSTSVITNQPIVENRQFPIAVKPLFQSPTPAVSAPNEVEAVRHVPLDNRSSATFRPQKAAQPKQNTLKIINSSSIIQNSGAISQIKPLGNPFALAPSKKISEKNDSSLPFQKRPIILDDDLQATAMANQPTAIIVNTEAKTVATSTSTNKSMGCTEIIEKSDSESNHVEEYHIDGELILTCSEKPLVDLNEPVSDLQDMNDEGIEGGPLSDKEFNDILSYAAGESEEDEDCDTSLSDASLSDGKTYVQHEKPKLFNPYITRGMYNLPFLVENGILKEGDKIDYKQSKPKKLVKLTIKNGLIVSGEGKTYNCFEQLPDFSRDKSNRWTKLIMKSRSSRGKSIRQIVKKFNETHSLQFFRKQ